MEDNLDLLILYSVKDENWKDYFLQQFENNDLDYINLITETIENLCWPLPLEKENQFVNSSVILTLYSQDFIDFFEKQNEQLSSLECLLNTKKTFGILHKIEQSVLKSSLLFNFCHDDFHHFHSEETENIIRAVKTQLKQSKSAKKKPKSSFKLVPRKVFEGKGRVHIILEQPLSEDQQLNVFTNTSVILTEIILRKLNPYCWQFDIPDYFLRGSAVLKVGISQNENILEVQSLKCECRLSQLCNLLSSCCNPAELMIDALEVNSYSALDSMLTVAFKKRFPKAELCELYNKEWETTYIKAKQEIPTLVHFAARYGLTQLMQELLQCPGTFSICNMKNSLGRTPTELAADFKNHNISKLLTEFYKLKNADIEIKKASSYDTLPIAPSVPYIKSSTSNGNIKNISDDNVYDILPSPPVPVLDYEEIKTSNSKDDTSFMPDFSLPPTNESIFLESQAKLLEINEAYKKGASELEVMSMFDKWKSTYRVDSEAKSTLDTLRNLYAERNKSKPPKKHSVSFSEFKHLFKFKFRRKSMDSLDVCDDLNEICPKYQKNRSKHGRNSKTFSSTSYTSASSSSSSDRLSFASENSDYYDYVSSFMSLNDLCEKNTRITNTSKFGDCKQNMEPLQNSSLFQSKRINFLPYSNKDNGTTEDLKLTSYISHNNEHTHLRNYESHSKKSTTTLPSSVNSRHAANLNKCSGYDFLPCRSPVPVNLSSETIKWCEDSNISQEISSPNLDYDVPKPPIQLQVENELNLSSSHEKLLHSPIKNRYNKEFCYVNMKCFSNNKGQQAYENLSPNTILPRRDSIPDEIAPLPPTFEEEHYKYVGTPVPVASIT